jgi:hypothetical protein
VTNLIRNCSHPDEDKWMQLSGFYLGTHETYESAERALRQREGTAPTTDDDTQCTLMGDSFHIESQQQLDVDSSVVDLLISAGEDASSIRNSKFQSSNILFQFHVYQLVLQCACM